MIWRIQRLVPLDLLLDGLACRCEDLFRRGQPHRTSGISYEERVHGVIARRSWAVLQRSGQVAQLAACPKRACGGALHVAARTARHNWSTGKADHTLRPTARSKCPISSRPYSTVANGSPLIPFPLSYTVYIYSYIAMPFKSPLTFDELRAISARSPAGSDGRALLWEIKRLQDRLRRVAQYLHGGSSQYGVIYDALITELNGEPAVQDWCADHRDGVPLGMQRNPADGVPDA